MTPPRLATYPELAPDELLYSYLGRLSQRNALRDPARVMLWFFKNESAAPLIDLPTGLSALQRNLGRFSPLPCAEQWIDRTTLLPYFEAFLPQPVRSAVRESMLRDGDQGLKWRMGLMANRFGATVTLRYCPLCVREDEQLHQSIHWHRAHHLPSVTACIHHAVSLVPCVTPSTTGNKQQLTLPPADVEHFASGVRPSDQLLRFAHASNELLHAGLPAVSTEVRAQVYWQAIVAAGYARTARFLDFERLASELRCHYADFDGFPCQARLLSSKATPLAWLRPLVLRPQRSLHPICHLLLIDFLYGGIALYRQAISQRAAEPSISDVPAPHLAAQTSMEHDVQALLLDASRSCRAVAATLGLSVNTVVKRRRELGVAISERRKALKADRLADVEEHLRRGMPAMQVANACHVSLASVYRIRSALPPDPPKKEAERLALRDRQRHNWERLLRRHRLKGVQAARHAVPALYAWLYRNDRDWLLDINGQLPSHHARRVLVNWPHRDAQLCACLNRFVRQFRQRSPDGRITASLLARAVGEGLVRRHASQLPKTMEKIQQLAQSPETFRSFRLERAATELRDEGQPLATWRILKRSGLRQRSSD